MTKRSAKVNNLDTKKIIDQNSRLIDALKNLNSKISTEDRKKKNIAELTEDNANSNDQNDAT